MKNASDASCDLFCLLGLVVPAAGPVDESPGGQPAPPANREAAPRPP